MRFYSLLDVDSISAKKDWLNLRITTTGGEIIIQERNRNELHREDPIFIVVGGKPLRAY